MSSLERANQIRSENKVLKEEIAEMSISGGLRVAAAILRDPQGSQGSLRLEHLVCAVRGMGPLKLTALLRGVSVKPFLKLHAIPEAQREVIARRLILQTRDSRGALR